MKSGLIDAWGTPFAVSTNKYFNRRYQSLGPRVLNFTVLLADAHTLEGREVQFDIHIGAHAIFERWIDDQQGARGRAAQL